MSDVTGFFIERFRRNLENTDEPARYYRPRPYRNAAVRFRKCSIEDFETRRDILVDEAGLNPFLFRADMIPGCDLLSDSGTTTMTMEQWAAMMLGDEAYGSNEGYFELLDAVEETFGPGWVEAGFDRGGYSDTMFLFHQGRAAENAFFTILARELRALPDPPVPVLSEGLLPELKERIESKIQAMPHMRRRTDSSMFIIPSNSHFDTTQGNIEDKRMIPLNLPCREHLAGDEDFPFRGNMDLEELENLLSVEKERVPLVYLTITNNTGGGQPVSMENIRGIRRITSKHGVPFFLDACRFAENAWFIKRSEEGYSKKSVKEIVHEVFSQADGFHISLKKDGLVNMGGALLVRGDGAFYEKFPGIREGLTDYQIMAEGHPTYGGLPGRDLKAISAGLRTVTHPEYLDARILQVQRFGDRLTAEGIPVIRPIGGHAVYIDMDRFFGDGVRDEDFKSIAFTGLMLIAGHRLCELGIYAFGAWDGRTETPPSPRVNYVRAAVPRLAYEDRDLFSVVEAARILAENRDAIPAVDVLYGRDLSLRHFKSRFTFRG